MPLPTAMIGECISLPNNPALAGSVLVSQGVALSLFTPLGLATSNGLLANLGF